MSIQKLMLLHKEHQEWLHEIDLYQDEIRFFQNSLGRLTAMDENEELSEKINDYRQDCLNRMQQIDALRYQIYRNEAEVGKRMELADRLKDHVIPEEMHGGLRKILEEFLLEFKAFKKNVTEFVLNSKKALLKTGRTGAGAAG